MIRMEWYMIHPMRRGRWHEKRRKHSGTGWLRSEPIVLAECIIHWHRRGYRPLISIIKRLNTKRIASSSGADRILE